MSFIKGFVVAGLAPVALILMLGIYLGPVEGDLTRIGNVSERSWGWNKPRLVIEQLPNIPSPQTKIIVIGDSFSAGSLWQSGVERATGLSFATYHWNAVGSPDCLPAAFSTLLQGHPQARFVVVQSVERHFVNRFSGWMEPDTRCPAAIPPTRRNVEQLHAHRKSGLDFSSELPDPMYLLRALAAEGRSYDRTEAAGQARIAPLTRGDLFSNRRSDRLLYYSDDAQERDWTLAQIADSLENMKKFTSMARARGVEPLFLIIPDKLTVYAPFLKEPPASPPADIWLSMSQEDLPSIALATLFAQEVTRHVDFYMPDDTHAGNEAFTMISEQVAAFIASVTAP